MPELDVLMTTHNRLDLTMASVNALYTYTTRPFHLIIVDDSTDLSPLYFAELQGEHDNITYIHSDVPYTSGNQIFNIGLAKTQTPFTAIVMNSVRVEPDWEIQPLQVFNEVPEVGIVALKNLFPDGRIESAGIALGPSEVVDFGKFQDFTTHVPVDMATGFQGHRQSLVYECYAAQWAFVFLRREAIPVLEEDVYNGFKGWDDIDNSLVVKKNGWLIYYCGGSSGFHQPRATRGDDSAEGSALNLENAENFFKRWGLWKGGNDEGVTNSPSPGV